MKLSLPDKSTNILNGNIPFHDIVSQYVGPIQEKNWGNLSYAN